MNWYRSTDEWKPFHHDAAAMKPAMAEKQNFTVAVSFGGERDAAFEHAQTKVRGTNAACEHAQTKVRETNAACEHAQTKVRKTNAAFEHVQTKVRETNAAF